MLTGRTPFGGPSEVVLALHETQEPERPAKKNPACRDLEAVCLKCLEKEPAKRYADCPPWPTTCGAGSTAWRLVARPLSGGERLVRWTRRNPALAGLYATLLVVVVGAPSWRAFQRQRYNNSWPARPPTGRRGPPPWSRRWKRRTRPACR